MRSVSLAAAMLLVCSAVSAQPPTPNWDAWKFLIGKWVGEGTGDMGQGVGYFTFEPDLDGNVLIRKNHSQYPATKARAAYSHDDLMIVFADLATKQTRALYADSEGHVIYYTATFSNGGDTLTFLSDVLPATPRFRLTYVRTKTDHMALEFEIAPPDQPDKFHKLIDATVRKSSEMASPNGH